MTSISEIMAARKALSGYIYETPIIQSHALSTKTGHEKVILKCENLQRTGSYHLRGHMYKVIRTIEKELDVDNFVTFSTANGGAALACAATAFQAMAHIVVPDQLQDSITRSIKHYGGKFYPCKSDPGSREEQVKQLMERYNSAHGKEHHKAVYVHPYTDRLVITGYGTVGVEVMLQTDCEIDCVVLPMGGGALFTGVSVAVKGMKPNVAVFAVEPFEAAVADPYVYFKRGDSTHDGDEAHEAEHGKGTKDRNRVVRGAALDHMLSTRFPHYQPRSVDGVIGVSQDEMRYAFRYVYDRCKLVVDTKSATAVAAVLARPEELRRYRKVAVILSGGNVNLNDVPKIAAPKL